MSFETTGWITGLLAFTTMAAGCIDANESGPSPSTTESAQPAAWDLVVPNNATGCTRVMPALFIPKAHAQGFLPTGFVAADANDFFHVQGPASGQAVVLLTAVRCKSSQWHPDGYDEAAVGLLVKAPLVPNVTAAPENMYEFGRAVNQGPAAETLANVGWDRIGHEISSTFTADPVPSGAARVVDAQGLVFSVNAPAQAVQDAFPIDIRWWHQTPSGLGYFDYKFRVQGQLGSGQCMLRADTIAAKLAQGTTCPPGSLYMVGPPFDVQSTFRHSPGLRVLP